MSMLFPKKKEVFGLYLRVKKNINIIAKIKNIIIKGGGGGGGGSGGTRTRNQLLKRQLLYH